MSINSSIYTGTYTYGLTIHQGLGFRNANGKIFFEGNGKVIFGNSDDVTSNNPMWIDAEDSSFVIKNSSDEMLSLTNTYISLNEDQNDFDFKLYSNVTDTGLFMDAGLGGFYFGDESYADYTELINVRGDIMFTYGDDRVIYVEANTGTNTGNDLSIKAGKGGPGGESIDGGDLYLYGGENGDSTSVSGYVFISGYDVSIDTVCSIGRLDIGANEVMVESLCNTSTAAPLLDLFRDSASPANNDYIGKIEFNGNNDNSSAEKIEYASIGAQITDITDGSEDGKLILRAMINGSLTDCVTIGTQGANFSGAVSNITVVDGIVTAAS